MLIYSKNGTITENQDKTNIRLEFDVPQGTNQLIIKYSYNPKNIDDRSLAHKAITDAMKKYNVNFFNPEAFLPVNNLVTLSFDENGKYRGACHRQSNEQTVIISDKNSTPGIINRTVEHGKWDVMLNIHFVGCPVEYNIEIEAGGVQ